MNNDFYLKATILFVTFYKICWVIWWFMNPEHTMMQVVRKALLIFGE